MEALFEFLFKYRPLLFERGDFMFSAPWPVYLAAVVGVALIVPTLLLYSRARGKSRPVDRLVLSILRTLALALILFSLFRRAGLVDCCSAKELFGDFDRRLAEYAFGRCE